MTDRTLVQTGAYGGFQLVGFSWFAPTLLYVYPDKKILPFSQGSPPPNGGCSCRFFAENEKAFHPLTLGQGSGRCVTADNRLAPPPPPPPPTLHLHVHPSCAVTFRRIVLTGGGVGGTFSGSALALDLWDGQCRCFFCYMCPLNLVGQAGSNKLTLGKKEGKTRLTFHGLQ